MYSQINLPRITSTSFSASKISSTRNLPYLSLVGSWSLALLGPHVTFVALSRGSFGDLFSALIMNEIYESENPSDIITPLQSSLAKTWKVNNIVSLFFSFPSSKPSLSSQGSTILRSYLSQSYEKHFFDARNTEPVTFTEYRRYTATVFESLQWQALAFSSHRRSSRRCWSHQI